MVYFGPPKKSFDFFKINSNDYADIYTEIDAPLTKKAKKVARYWEEQFRQNSSQYKQYIEKRLQAISHKAKIRRHKDSKKTPETNLFQQFSILTQRYANLVVRDKVFMGTLMFIVPVLAFLLLIISKSNWLIGNTEDEIMDQLTNEIAMGSTSATYAIVGKGQQLLFMMALVVIFFGLFATSYEINKEYHIYKRERLFGLHLLPYLGSKVAVLGTLILFQCFLFLLVLHAHIDFPENGLIFSTFIEFYITLSLSTFASMALGLFISAALSNRDTIIYIVLLLLFMQILFAGVIFEIPENGMQFLSYATLSRWAMEGLGSSANLEYLKTLTRTRVQLDPSISPEPIDILSEQNFSLNYARDKTHLIKTWGILLSSSLFFLGAATCSLKLNDPL